MPLFLTFDIGTTSLKTALVGDDGRILAVHTQEYSFSCPQPDWAEMDPEAYWNAAVTGSRAVFSRSGAASSDLAAIGFSSQGQTFIPVDRAGNALHNAIVWTDKRANEITRDWGREWLSIDEFRRSSGYPWLAVELTVFKVGWLARYAPQAHRAWKFLCLPDYLIFRMTGRAATDRVMGQYNGFYDLRESGWNPRLLAAAGIEADQLPDLLEPGQPAGTLLPEVADQLGVPAGVPVCVGANDQIAGAVGAGNVRPGVVSETTGTALAVVASTPVLMDDARLVVGRHAASGVFYAMPFANTSAVVLKWFRDLCCAGEDYNAFLAGVEQVEPGSNGLTMLPHFAGTASPTFNPNARGAFSGLTLGHTRAHISRAILEACCCELRECVDLVREGGISFDSVRSLGGAARSDLWLQMKADMLGIPVERPQCSDAASLGAAMLAAAGTGAFACLDEASTAWYKPSHRFEPNEKLQRVYDEVYERYCELYARLYE